MSVEIERVEGLGGPVVVNVPRGAVSPGGGALYSGGSSYSAGFPVLPGAQGLSQLPDIKQAEQLAQQAGIEIPGVDALVKELGLSLPGIPVSPDTVIALVTGDIDVETIVREAAFQTANLAVPGLGMFLSAAYPFVASAAKDVVGVFTGQPQKKTRRGKKWRRIQAVFNDTMDMYPLAMFKTGQIPSPDFLQLFQRNLNDPAVWTRAWYGPREGQTLTVVPEWLHSGAIKGDYDGSGIKGPRTSYFDRAQRSAEIVKMMDKYYKLPGKVEHRARAMRDQVELVKREAEKKAIRKKAQESMQRAERGHGRKLAAAARIFTVLKEVIKQKVAAYPEAALKKDAQGKPLGPKAYVLAVLAELNRLFPPEQVKGVVTPTVWKNTFEQVLRENPQLLKRTFELGIQRALKEEIKKQVTAHPAAGLQKDAQGKYLGPKIYVLPVLAELKKRFPPTLVTSVVTPAVWKNTFEQVTRENPQLVRRMFEIAAQRQAAVAPVPTPAVGVPVPTPAVGVPVPARPAPTPRLTRRRRRPSIREKLIQQKQRLRSRRVA